MEFASPAPSTEARADAECCTTAPRDLETAQQKNIDVECQSVADEKAALFFYFGEKRKKKTSVYCRPSVPPIVASSWRNTGNWLLLTTARLGSSPKMNPKSMWKNCPGHTHKQKKLTTKQQQQANPPRLVTMMLSLWRSPTPSRKTNTL